MKDVIEQVRYQFEQGKIDEVTLEHGRGETYSHGRPTLYGHGDYPRSSVLYGRRSRLNFGSFENLTDARVALGTIKREMPKLRVDDWTETGGCSHIPVDIIVSHLPDDTDY